MKAMFTMFTLAFLCLAGAAPAQEWSQLTTNYDSSLYNLYFVNADVGYASGDHGKVLKTINGGNSWVTLNTGINQGLASIHFVDPMIGYAASGFYNDYCSMVKTIDGGNSWTTVNTAAGKTAGGMWFLDAERGFYAWADDLFGSSVIGRTLDGGASWDTVYSGNDWISYFYFVDENTGFASVTNGGVLKTTDGGASWSLNAVPGSSWNSGIYFVDENIGFVGGGPPNPAYTMYKTTDGGLGWTQIESVPTMIFKIDFADANIGYALTVGTSGAGSLIKTVDQGETWLAEETPVDDIRGVSFLNPNLGFAVGENGVILRFNDTQSTGSIEQDQLSVSPVPASDWITISLKRNSNPINLLKMYNTTGALVKSMRMENQAFNLSVGDLPDGVYILEIMSENGWSNRKIVIRH
ncbi:MAG: T9SS type A sorting domain-containing protein [Bacteroidetes bacterium]|nr:T9SS type A sorting domain-containing protein [Bacteroidota bacterium]